MPAVMKTPGVYIVEESAFPNSVVEVATAVPAFIGHTERADNKGKSLAGKPKKITSMVEYHNYFGGPPKPTFTINVEDGDDTQEVQAAEAPEVAEVTHNKKTYTLEQDSGKYILYRSMRLFFANGGGPCYIVSVGNYNTSVTETLGDLNKPLGQLVKEQEPTMIVIPDLMLIEDLDVITKAQEAVLLHCGNKMKNRVALLDIPEGYKSLSDDPNPVSTFRNNIGINYLDYAMAYYPWLKTSIIEDKDLHFENFSPDGTATLPEALKLDLGLESEPEAEDKQAKAHWDLITKLETWENDITDKTAAEIKILRSILNNSLVAMSDLYKAMLVEIKDNLNLLPPAAAMAGIYTMVDNSTGVWKAPANVSLSSVVAPAVNITHYDQEDLNVTPQGKSINAIRPFVGEGTLVWGARTLDGNSLDWRYIQVRRTMIMLEESIRLAAKAYVFENNNAKTWVTMKSMIGNFLTGIWKRGGLAGASPGEAFSVFVGLGETMTPEDILEGILKITVLVAITRPAEFIEITFQQQMQQS